MTGLAYIVKSIYMYFWRTISPYHISKAVSKSWIYSRLRFIYKRKRKVYKPSHNLRSIYLMYIKKTYKQQIYIYIIIPNGILYRRIEHKHWTENGSKVFIYNTILYILVYVQKKLVRHSK